MHDLFEIIGTTRSMRRLKPDPVPDELIKKILEAGTAAANGGNNADMAVPGGQGPGHQEGRAGLVQEGVRRGRRPALCHQRTAARGDRRDDTTASTARWNT